MYSEVASIIATTSSVFRTKADFSVSQETKLAGTLNTKATASQRDLRNGDESLRVLSGSPDNVSDTADVINRPLVNGKDVGKMVGLAVGAKVGIREG